MQPSVSAARQCALPRRAALAHPLPTPTTLQMARHTLIAPTPLMMMRLRLRPYVALALLGALLCSPARGQLSYRTECDLELDQLATSTGPSTKEDVVAGPRCKVSDAAARTPHVTSLLARQELVSVLHWVCMTDVSHFGEPTCALAARVTPPMAWITRAWPVSTSAKSQPPPPAQSAACWSIQLLVSCSVPAWPGVQSVRRDAYPHSDLHLHPPSPGTVHQGSGSVVSTRC